MRRYAIGLLAAVCSVAASCSGGGIDDVSSGGAPGELAATVELGGIQRLELALVQPQSYRPDEVVLTDQAAVIVSDLLYDGLTEAQGSEGVLRPGLADRWSADDDFLRWTFALDPFAGVSAGAVVETLVPLTTEHAGPRPRGRSVAALAAGMRSVTAADHTTVIIDLERPNAGLPWVLSGLPYSIVGEAGAPTGDYSVESDDANGLVLRRRAGRESSDGDGLREVVVTWVEQPADGYRLVTDEVVDGAVVDPPSSAQAAERFGTRFPATSAVRFYVLNPESETLTDREHRARLLAAVDREAVVAEVSGLQLTTADGLVPATSSGHGAGGCRPTCDGDPVGDLVGSDPVPGSGSTLPADTELQVSFAGEDQAAMAEAVAAQLTGAGFETAWAELGARDLAAAIVDGSTDLFAFGWVAPATSVDGVLPPLLAVDSPANVARIDSPTVTALLDRAAVTADDEARWAILEQAHRAALDEAKILPVAYSTSLLVTTSEMAGLAIRADGSIDLETVQ